jgi:hypothetical protein
MRMPDREACAAALADALWDMPVTAKSPVLKKRWDAAAGAWRWASVSPRSTILEILGTMGGAKALETVAAAAKEVDPELQDTGLHVLGQWLSTDAAPVLLDLATTAREDRYRLAAVNGYIRIAKEFDMPESERAAMCRAALGAAARDAEKKLVLEAMRRHPSVDMLEVAVAAAAVPALKDEATGVAIEIAQKVGGDAPAVRALLAQIGHKPMQVEIIKAEYGTGAKFVDVTEILRRHVRGFPSVVLPSANYNASFGGDPAPGVVKELKIRYRIDGKEGQVSLTENAPVVLPPPK